MKGSRMLTRNSLSRSCGVWVFILTLVFCFTGKLAHAAAEVEVNPLSHDFGNVLVGTLQPKFLEIQNIGDEDLFLIRGGWEGEYNGGFYVSSVEGCVPPPGATNFSQCIIPPGGTVVRDIRFFPAEVREYNAVYVIETDDSDEGLTYVSLRGNGVTENTAPVGSDDAYSTDEDTVLVYPADGVLSNDFDNDNDPLGAILVSGPAYGTLILNADGSFTYTPDANYSGRDSFTYKANDGSSDSNISTVTITINPVNDAPILDPVGNVWEFEGNQISFILTATDQEDSLVSFYAQDLPSGASLDSMSGEFTWTPNHSQEGEYNVSFFASDGFLEDKEVITLQIIDGEGPPIKKKGFKRSSRETVTVIEVGEVLKEVSGFIIVGKDILSDFDVKVDLVAMIPEDATVDVVTYEPCPEKPVGFQVGDMCFDLSTNAESFESANVCVTYDDTDMNSENSLKLEHYEDGKWQNITTGQSVDKNTICGQTTTLSPFAIVRSVGGIIAPTEPQPVNADVNVNAAFIDQESLNTHTAEFNWGDDVTSPASVAEENGSGTVTGVHQYTTPGVYRIALSVYDNFNTLLGDSNYQYLVVYDPSGGFVTGGGWIVSPEGACASDPTLSGKANFGFVSKYKKGASVPSGNTEFQFQAAGLKFTSSAYDWLVMAGAQAKFKGVGTINGQGDYGFMLTAIDGALSNDGQDKIRIKIWDRVLDATVYDNMVGLEEDVEPTTILGGGSIIIHSGK